MDPTGTDWRRDELDAIVTDYFDMLAAEVAGRTFVKARHRANLAAHLGRSNWSIEFKHKNISAVLDELGAPWIPGYRPARNYLGTIFDAIDAYLTEHPTAIAPPLERTPVPANLHDIFVSPPFMATMELPVGLKRLIQKYDPIERDARNRALARAGEEFVLDLEHRRLNRVGRTDLAGQVRWVAEVDGDVAGYDILSFDESGVERLIEVKTTNGSARTPFLLSRNEHALAKVRIEQWRLYRVHNFVINPRIFMLAPPLETAVKLSPELWRASF